jgi:hypothetical protein
VTPYPYVGCITFDGTNKVANAAGQIYAKSDTAFTTPLQAVDASGLAVELRSNADALLPPFFVEGHTSVVWKSGDWVFILVTSEPVPGEPGPQGVGVHDVTAAGDQMKVILSDGRELPVTLPTGAGGSNEGVAEYVNVEGPTRAALNVAVLDLAERVATSAVRASESRAGGPNTDAVSVLHNTTQAGVLAAGTTTMTSDTEHYSVNGSGIKITTSAANTGAWVLRDFSPALTGEDYSAAGIEVWVEDTALIDSLQVEFNTDVGVWKRTATAAALDDLPAANGLRTGLNVLRWNWVSGGFPNWATITRVRVLVQTNAATSYTVQSVFTEAPRRKKAQLVFINDGAFRNYENYFAKRMRDLGFPTQWAIGCSTVQLATKSGPNLTVEELRELQALGDMVSFHNHDTLNLLGGGSEIASTATGAQLLDWTQKAQAWLKARNFRGWYVRSAWLQNNAPNAPTSGVWDILAATPTHTGRTALQSWPLQSPNAYPRITYHGMAPATLDTHFANLKETRQLGVFYTHDVNNAGGSDMTEAEADYFLTKCEQGVTEGWLEGVTMETLLMRDGARYVDNGTGNPQFIYTRDGQTKILGG